MNAKLIVKTLFLIAVLLFLVLMGMENRHRIDFTLSQVLPQKITLPAAIMYYAFFAIGVLTGTIMTAGGKKGGAKSNKVNNQ